jgi:hypothetical protein
MSKPKLKDCIKHKFPEGWKPSPGQMVIVPAETVKRSWSAVVEGVFDDIVRVRIPRLKYSKKEFLLSDVRPHPYLTLQDLEKRHDD